MQDMAKPGRQIYRCGLYARLSREDGDKAESDSITSQLNMLESYCHQAEDMEIACHYVDDGFTGTSFERPAFRQMMEAVEEGRINCIIVKDLSRFGRDYIDTGRYLERILPQKGVRFIAINDNVDSINGAYDMMLPIKNIFNSQYARDISGKIRSSFDTRRRRGEFIGAFCSYGYCRDPEAHSHLVIDEGAAGVVRRIYDMFEGGQGKDAIARRLNDEGIPCPSQYKRLMGENYKNGLKLDGTTYWTYSTIHRILCNPVYAGHMVQGKYCRPAMHGKARLQERDKWIVKQNTHDPVVSAEQWERVQRLLKVRERSHGPVLEDPLRGFIKCGLCGRSMVSRGKGEKAKYSCGSYERYGTGACSGSRIWRSTVAAILLGDLNSMLEAIPDMSSIRIPKTVPPTRHTAEKERIQKSIERMERLRRSLYEDYKAGLLSGEDYISYRAEYEAGEEALRRQLQVENEIVEQQALPSKKWAGQLIEQRRIESLDRVTLAATVEGIYVYNDDCVKICYRFSDIAGACSRDDA